MSVKSSGIAAGLANTRLPGSAKFDGQGRQMPRSSQGGGGGGGGWAQVELTDALINV